MRLQIACVLSGALALAPSGARAQDEATVQRIAREVVPGIQRAVGLTFKRAPRILVRSRDEVHRYIGRKLAGEYSADELAAMQRAYRAFALIPEGTDLGRLMLDLYSEQVVGYYDPDSSALFVVRGADSLVLRTLLAHELVHALQDQYTPLNAILKLRRQNDRAMAAQAVTEGQATLASIQATIPGATPSVIASAWSELRREVRREQSAMPVFSRAPLYVREGILFPYLVGPLFMLGFEERRTRPDEMPYGERMPVTTAQVLHADLYAGGERPWRLRFAPAASDTLIYEDDFGEFETGIVLQALGLSRQTAEEAAAGWSGDRFEVLGSTAGTVVVWASVWRSSYDADQFQWALGDGWKWAHERAAARDWRLERVRAAGQEIVRLVDAPKSWSGWAQLPAIEISRSPR